MKGKINSYGNLLIERAGKMKPQICPAGFDENRLPAFCGNWCPLFGEPRKEYKTTITGKIRSYK